MKIMNKSFPETKCITGSVEVNFREKRQGTYIKFSLNARHSYRIGFMFPLYSLYKVIAPSETYKILGKY